MSAELRIRTPDGQERRVPLEADALILGRARDAELSYPDDGSISRRHVEFGRHGERWTVTDLASRNGTYVNGERLTGSRPLVSGDRLGVGRLQIRFVESRVEEGGDVVFVPGASSDLSARATVMTSLGQVLSEAVDGSGLAKADSGELDVARQFKLPIVRALIRAGRELVGDRPLGELFELILAQAVEAVRAGGGVIMTLEGGALVPRATLGEGFRISGTVRDRVLNAKQSLLVRDVGLEEALLHQMSIVEQQVHSLMAVPLQTEDEVIGLIYVDSRRSMREFTVDDLSLLTVLANVAAIRIGHERHLELQRRERERSRDLEQAAAIQRGILPRRPPDVAGLDLSGHNAPCHTVGGDYYDFIPFSDGRLALVLGDVAGKGMAAAMIMSNLQARVQILTEEPLPLDVLMSRLDKSVAANCPPERFITLFLCVVDPRTGAATYCNAGHNPALVVRASGKVEELGPGGTMLGPLPQFGYVQRDLHLEPGDLLAIYSDGITEAVGPEQEMFGKDRLAEALVARRADPAEEIVSAIVDAVGAFSTSEIPDDDITLLVARRVR